MRAGDESEPALRVVHVNHTAHRGGAELALVRLLGARYDWRAALCAPPGGGGPEDSHDAEDSNDAFAGLAGRGVELDRRLPGLPGGGTRGGPALAIRYLAALRAGARSLASSPPFRDADLVHANTAAAAIIGALANRGRPVPLVVHLRDLVTPQSLGRAGFTAFTRIALRRASGVIANSASTLESAAGLIPSGVPAAVIPSPIGIHAPDGPDPGRAARPVRRIGVVGRLQHWKGQHVFLHAFALAFRDTDVRAYLAGAAQPDEPGYTDELRALAARLGIAGQVTLLGYVEDVAGLLDSLDILVHASIRPEPLGQSVLQGLAYAKPVVASEGGGPSEWIRSGVNGLLVAPDQAEALAAALRSLAEDADLRTRLAEAAARTPGILADDECALAHGRFFREVVGAGARPVPRQPIPRQPVRRQAEEQPAGRPEGGLGG
ncbi:hypothetical protein GCM10023322_28130 [Rugosimonospora acidiphila]|uniref:Uncharacterized protein n=1 Tax=Rugosimonospora acidiphila TaxID=556531 RepID=A0ABP9RS64_9ACTN